MIPSVSDRYFFNFFISIEDFLNQAQKLGTKVKEFSLILSKRHGKTLLRVTAEIFQETPSHELQNHFSKEIEEGNVTTWGEHFTSFKKSTTVKNPRVSCAFLHHDSARNEKIQVLLPNRNFCSQLTLFSRPCNCSQARTRQVASTQMQFALLRICKNTRRQICSYCATHSNNCR